MALIDIEIDEETPCLVHRVSGETYQTEFARLTFDDLEQVGEEAGWIGFDWRFYLEDKNFEVYKLLVQGDNAIQGIVCLGVRGNWVEVYLVENAPWNIGRERQEFRGVGAHLFAIACRRSFEAGCEGYVAFYAKTGLVDYYVRALRAEAMGPNRLFIATPRALQLVDTYFGEGGAWHA